MSVTRVQIVSVPVRDQDRARDFYVDVLGLDLVRDNPMGPGGRWVQVAPKGAATTLTLVTWFDSMPPGSLRGLVLETDDLDADVTRLGERGLTFAEDGVQVAPWGRYVTFADPEGNGIVLQETRV
ncbi:glyoxalase superfamily protein [Micromonospora sp. WMMD1128]|uniref:glyoxalase superfamily protein n=1 Tax=Micromonospora sp. WMMD1128 TaxID=3015150 RepID=UPI00248CEB5D|nr:glyoxalase superfamily protein [Micromonospora sp. WMMD1128]WBB75559.1 glyoxalase superfamily protein [Micromonospora sp. WMMD1128]